MQCVEAQAGEVSDERPLDQLEPAPQSGTSHDAASSGVGSAVDGVQHRRRASDRARERARLVLERGDHAAYVMATRQVEEGLRRRADWRPADPAPTA